VAQATPLCFETACGITGGQSAQATLGQRRTLRVGQDGRPRGGQASSDQQTYSASQPAFQRVSPKTWPPGSNDRTFRPTDSISPASTIPRMGWRGPLTPSTNASTISRPAAQNPPLTRHHPSTPIVGYIVGLAGS
jgi:hypothetical protein